MYRSSTASTDCEAEAGKATEANCGRCWNALTARVFAIRGHRRHEGRHAHRAQPGPSRKRRGVHGRTGDRFRRVSSLDDLRAIATLTGSGVEGAIVGKALYAGRFTLADALAAVSR